MNPSPIEERKLTEGSSAVNCKQVTVADVLCGACNQLLFWPAVLNCGHVYCEACITIPEDGVIKCRVCQCRHPSGFPELCKEFDRFLEEQFSSEYALRRSSTQLNQERRSVFKVPSSHIQQKRTFFNGGLFMAQTFIQWLVVICEGCVQLLGIDIGAKTAMKSVVMIFVEICHNTGLKLPGRFNPKHTPEHQLELVKPVIN